MAPFPENYWDSKGFTIGQAIYSEVPKCGKTKCTFHQEMTELYLNIQEAFFITAKVSHWKKRTSVVAAAFLCAALSAMNHTAERSRAVDAGKREARKLGHTKVSQ